LLWTLNQKQIETLDDQTCHVECLVWSQTQSRGFDKNSFTLGIRPRIECIFVHQHNVYTPCWVRIH